MISVETIFWLVALGVPVVEVLALVLCGIYVARGRRLREQAQRERWEWFQRGFDDGRKTAWVGEPDQRSGGERTFRN